MCLDQYCESWTNSSAELSGFALKCNGNPLDGAFNDVSHGNLLDGAFNKLLHLRY